ncbi:hypothetical protein Tco_0003473 [Tanacetum coccineum]
MVGYRRVMMVSVGRIGGWYGQNKLGGSGYGGSHDSLARLGADVVKVDSGGDDVGSLYGVERWRMMVVADG